MQFLRPNESRAVAHEPDKLWAYLVWEDESISTDRERKIGVNRHGGDVIGDVTDGGLPLHIFDYVTSK